MTNPPLVSAYMTVYNAKRCVSEAEESILAQTFAAFGFIEQVLLAGSAGSESAVASLNNTELVTPRDAVFHDLTPPRGSDRRA